MINKQILLINTVSILLTTTTLQAECIDCFATIVNPNKSPTNFQKENQTLATYPDNIKEKEFEILLANRIDKSFEVIVDGMKISRFSDETYTANEVDNDDILLVTIPLEKIEDKILSKSELRNSEYYCDSDKKPIYYNKSSVYECV